MLCANCGNSILSPKHKNDCLSINMYQLKEQNMPIKKKMMTYGLCGCTAIIIIDKKYNRILMGHHPEKNEILKWFLQNYYTSHEYNYIVILKLPGEYIKNDLGKFDFVGRDEKFWKTIFPKNPNLKVIYEPYDLCKTISINSKNYFSYNSSLYFRQTDKDSFEYTDKYGRWIRI